jgi:DNA-binding HxlR family transcriptional regulator
MSVPPTKTDNGLIGIYSNLDQELEDALGFLKPALKNNEAILLIINESWDKDSVYNLMREKWNMSADQIKELENKGGLDVVTSAEWYLARGRGWAPDIELIHQSWANLVTKSIKLGKSAMRVFVSTSTLFSLGVEKEFLKYEFLLPSTFGFPIIGVCAYQTYDLSTYLTKAEIKTLCSCRSLISMTNRFDIIENPPVNEHIILLYNNEYERDTLVAHYINEGLKREQLCIYASVVNFDDGTLNETLRSKIVDLDKNIKDGNLVPVNLSSHYATAALTGDLEPFKVLQTELTDKAKNRRNKYVRLVGDLVGFLFENKGFDECLELEKWWHHKPFEGSYLCPYPNSLCDKLPYDYHKYRVFGNHDIVVDGHGTSLGSYIPRTSLSNDSILHLPVTKIDNSMDILRRKFTLHILRNMISLKQNRFGEFVRSIEGISSKTLSIRLKEMEEEGLISRVVVSSRPLQTEYHLTEKGKMIGPILELLAEFSMRYEPNVILKDEKQRDFKGLFGSNARLSSVYDY